MTAFVQPGSFTAGKHITLLGDAYQPGDTVPQATIKALRNLSALVSNRTLIPDVDPWGRHNRLTTPTPTDFPAAVRDEIPAV